MLPYVFVISVKLEIRLNLFKAEYFLFLFLSMFVNCFYSLISHHCVCFCDYFILLTSVKMGILVYFNKSPIFSTILYSNNATLIRFVRVKISTIQSYKYYFNSAKENN